MNLVSSVKIPVLLGHGEDDPTVHVDHSRRMARALEGAGKQVELVVYDDEIHGRRGQANRRDWYTRLAGFFDGCVKN